MVDQVSRAFWNHHLDRATRYELEDKTIQNCHVIGLTSICLHDEPNNRIRIFFAEHNHELWRNKLSEHGCFIERMSLGVHSHRTDISLTGLIGDAQNIEVHLHQHSWNNRLEKCRYRSAIVDGRASIDRTGDSYDVLTANHKSLNPIQSAIWMPANQMHTIYVPKGEQAAWMVVEGKSAKDYHPFCYTNNPYMDRNLYKMGNANGWPFTVLMCIMRSLGV